MWIGLSGTKWTGKSTTIRRLELAVPDARITTVRLSKIVMRCPHPIQEKQTIDASRWVAAMSVSGDALDAIDRVATALHDLRCWAPTEFDVPDPFDAHCVLQIRWKNFKGAWQFMWIKPDGTEVQVDNAQTHVRLALCESLNVQQQGGPIELIFKNRDLVLARLPQAISVACSTAVILEHMAAESEKSA